MRTNRSSGPGLDRGHRYSAFRQPSSGVARIACCEPCDLEDGDHTRQGTLWNVSVLGAYIVLNEPLPEVGTRMRLYLTLPGDSAPIVTEVRVAWQNPPSPFRGCGTACMSQPPGCGLEFMALSDADRDRIQARVLDSHPPAK